ncbi:MAG TPA: serine peptidase, partial [Hyphomicrobium sp.]
MALGLTDRSATAVAQFKPGTPAETLSFADIVDRVKPAVVSISTTNEVKVADRGSNRGPGA